MSKTEIVVSDNASLDDVGEISKKYAAKYPNNIKYFKNKTNLGFDRNVDLAVQRSSGKFVWILSDDDFIEDGAIEYVQNVIENYIDDSSALIHVYRQNTKHLKTEQDGVCKDGNIFFLKTRFNTGLISNNIVAKAIWQKSSVDQFFDSGWIHFGYALEALSSLKGHTAYVISRELIRTGGEPRWGHEGTFIYTGLKLVEIFQRMPRLGYNKSIKKMADFVIKGGYPKGIPIAKVEGLKVNLLLLKRFYALYRQYPSFWLIDLPLLLIPRMLYIPVVYLYRLTK